MAYYCLHELHLLPSAFLQLSRRERAFIVAAIEHRIEQEKKKEKEMKRGSRKRR